MIRPLAREARARAGRAAPPPRRRSRRRRRTTAPATPARRAGRRRRAAPTPLGDGQRHGVGRRQRRARAARSSGSSASTARRRARRRRTARSSPSATRPSSRTCSRCRSAPRSSFRNDDAIFHNVFSLSKPNDFDTGLYKQGGDLQQTFKRAGRRCRCCATSTRRCSATSYVVDTPYYAQADGSGAFTIKGVPPGDYELTVWHEAASKPIEQRSPSVRAASRGLSLQVGGDKRPPQFVPDKSGKPRQSHIGY